MPSCLGKALILYIQTDHTTDEERSQKKKKNCNNKANHWGVQKHAGFLLTCKRVQPPLFFCFFFLFITTYVKKKTTKKTHLIAKASKETGKRFSHSTTHLLLIYANLEGFHVVYKHMHCIYSTSFHKA